MAKKTSEDALAELFVVAVLGVMLMGAVMCWYFYEEGRRDAIKEMHTPNTEAVLSVPHG